MLRVLAYQSDLRQKAEILKQIKEIQPNINKLLTCITNWNEVGRKLHQSSYFKDIVTLANKFFQMTNADKFASDSAFQL